MKAKYYRIKKQLNSHEAGVYLKKLTCVDLSEREFYGLMGDNLPIYLKMNDGRALDGSIDDVSLTLTPDGLQKICSQHHLFGGDGLIAGFYLPKSTSDKQNATHVDLQGTIYSNDVVASKGKSVAWQAKYGDLHGSLVFLSSDIEALAAKMNSQPDAQALEQEIKTLRAEVDRLKAKSKELKKTDDLRQIRNMAKAIYGIAVDKYSYDPEKERNAATGAMSRVADKKGVKTSRGTIKKYIDLGRQYLNEDGE